MRSSAINAPLLSAGSESLLAKPPRFLPMGPEAPVANEHSTAAETRMERKRLVSAVSMKKGLPCQRGTGLLSTPVTPAVASRALSRVVEFGETR